MRNQSIRLAAITAITATTALSACGEVMVNGGYQQQQPQQTYAGGYGSSGSAQGSAAPAPSGQYLYLPASNLPLNAVQGVTIQTTDGRQFSLGPGDVRAAASGRLAVALPGGVTTGTATVTVNGQQISVPFHIVVNMAAAPVMTTAVAPQCDARSAGLTGEWRGTISTSHAGSQSVVHLQLLPDCRTVQGLVSLASAEMGSVESTIEGTWDAASGALIAHDTQLFNVRPQPGHDFCPTDRYALTMTANGQLVGQNQSTTGCFEPDGVQLYRAQ